MGGWGNAHLRIPMPRLCATVRGPPEHNGLAAHAVPALREEGGPLDQRGRRVPLQGFGFLFHRLSLQTLPGGGEKRQKSRAKRHATPSWECPLERWHRPKGGGIPWTGSVRSSMTTDSPPQ